MQLSVDITSLTADGAGELFMQLINPNARWGYTTREHEENFMEEYLQCSSIPEHIAQHMWETSEIVTKLSCPSFTAYLQWDGDGVIVIDWGSELYLVNTDMKKSYEWEWRERVD